MYAYSTYGCGCILCTDKCKCKKGTGVKLNITEDFFLFLNCVLCVWYVYVDRWKQRVSVLFSYLALWLGMKSIEKTFFALLVKLLKMLYTFPKKKNLKERQRHILRLCSSETCLEYIHRSDTCNSMENLFLQFSNTNNFICKLLYYS